MVFDEIIGNCCVWFGGQMFRYFQVMFDGSYVVVGYYFYCKIVGVQMFGVIDVGQVDCWCVNGYWWQWCIGCCGVCYQFQVGQGQLF